MKNINPYNKEKFFKEFSTTVAYKQLVQDFDILSFEWSLPGPDNDVTPRQIQGSFKSRFSVVPFYYLNFLLEKNPETIYDLGCGWNIFKKYIPNIIGIGAETPGSKYFYADIHDFVDDDFIKGHQNYFESVFSINALHFRPLSNFLDIVTEFYSMIKSNGRGFLTLNLQRMIERDPIFKNVDHQEILHYVEDQLQQLSYINFLVKDIRIAPIDEVIDGNVRLVIQK